MIPKSRRIVLCLAVCLAAAVAQAAKRPVRKPKYDPKVPAIDLFEAIDQGKIETTVVARNPHEATLSITNTSDAPVSVKMPPAVVAVHVLKQFIGQGNGRGAQGQGNGGGAGGMAQSIGGGMQNMMGGQNGINNGMNGGNMLGNGFGNGVGNGMGNGFGIFSVAPEKTVQVPLRTVCLSHGRPDPRPKMSYRLVKLEDYTHDAVLQETLKIFAAGSLDLPTAQAAAWHLTDNLSWDALRNKQIDRLGGLDPLPFFSEDELRAAEELIQQARRSAKEKAIEQPNDPPRAAQKREKRTERAETAAR